MKTHLCSDGDTCGMETSAFFIGLRVALCLLELKSAFALNGAGDGPKRRAGPPEPGSGGGVSTEASSLRCKLQGTTGVPAFSMDGDYVIGGVFSLHNSMHTVKHNYTTIPEPLRCTGRLVRGSGGV